MEHREETIRLWFSMWIQQTDLGIDRIFSDEARYIESWGPEYQGSGKIKYWFKEWNTRGKVLVWDIKQFFHREDQTVVEWYFRNVMKDGKVETFDGISLIRWTPEGKICFLQEFGCNEARYDPYESGGYPHFRTGDTKWF